MTYFFLVLFSKTIIVQLNFKEKSHTILYKMSYKVRILEQTKKVKTKKSLTGNIEEFDSIIHQLHKKTQDICTLVRF